MNPPAPKTRRIEFNLPRKLYAAVARAAREDFLSISAWIRTAIKEKIDKKGEGE